MRKNFKFINTKENSNEAKKKMIQEKINQMPILDDKGNLIDLILLNDLFNKEEISIILS